MSAPPSDSVIIAVAPLVDDPHTETREPSHSDLEFQIGRRLTQGDPKAQGHLVGKAKRVRATLYWLLDNNQQAGEAFSAEVCGTSQVLFIEYDTLPVE